MKASRRIGLVLLAAALLAALCACGGKKRPPDYVRGASP